MTVLTNHKAGAVAGPSGGRRGGQQKQIGEELCSSSQSLYSFLPSSDDNDITDFLQVSYINQSEIY